MQPRLKAMLKAHYTTTNNKYNKDNKGLEPFQRYESKAEMASAVDARVFA